MKVHPQNKGTDTTSIREKSSKKLKLWPDFSFIHLQIYKQGANCSFSSIFVFMLTAMDTSKSLDVTTTMLSGPFVSMECRNVLVLGEGA